MKHFAVPFFGLVFVLCVAVCIWQVTKPRPRWLKVHNDTPNIARVFVYSHEQHRWFWVNQFEPDEQSSVLVPVGEFELEVTFKDAAGRWVETWPLLSRWSNVDVDPDRLERLSGFQVKKLSLDIPPPDAVVKWIDGSGKVVHPKCVHGKPDGLLGGCEQCKAELANIPPLPDSIGPLLGHDGKPVKGPQ